MNRKQKQLLKQRQTTRQLMGIRRINAHGLTAGNEELVFFLVYPDNLSVLSVEAIRLRVQAFTALLKAKPDLELLALDSQETFGQNREFYRTRLEEETNPALRELLRQDSEHLDIPFSQTCMTSLRQPMSTMSRRRNSSSTPGRCSGTCCWVSTPCARGRIPDSLMATRISPPAGSWCSV